MSDKEILSQLNKLKDIKPDSKWREESKGVLMNQIYGFGSSEERVGFFMRIYQSLPVRVLRTIPQPVLVVFVLMSMLGGGITSFKVARETKPGDSLYVAKIVSEKTQRAFTFDEKKKLKLEIEFAKNRAQEIDKILSDDDSDNDDQVKDMIASFNKDLGTIKTKIKEMNHDIDDVEVAVNDDENDDLVEDDAMVFSANSGKDENRIETTEVDEIATTTIATTTDMIEDDSGDAHLVLTEAGELLDGDDYLATLRKLDKAEEIVTNIALNKNVEATSTEAIVDGEESDIATSTERIVDDIIDTGIGEMEKDESSVLIDTDDGFSSSTEE